MRTIIESKAKARLNTDVAFSMNSWSIDNKYKIPTFYTYDLFYKYTTQRKDTSCKLRCRYSNTLIITHYCLRFLDLLKKGSFILSILFLNYL